MSVRLIDSSRGNRQGKARKRLRNAANFRSTTNYALLRKVIEVLVFGYEQ